MTATSNGKTMHLPLKYISVRCKREHALTIGEVYLNLEPDFQRTYITWPVDMQTKLVESIIIGRAMNPIWTIDNPQDQSEEVLDGMHRLKTALGFVDNKFKLIGKCFTISELGTKYDGKYFRDLDDDSKHSIRNYNFTWNALGPELRRDGNKRRVMYKLLNRSSNALNDFEADKPMLIEFYNLLQEFKDDFIYNWWKKDDQRGNVEEELMNMIVLSDTLTRKSWTSLNVLRDKWLEDNLGNTESTVSAFIESKGESIKARLRLLNKIIQDLNGKNFVCYGDQKKLHTLRLPYRFVFARLVFKLKNISIYNRHIQRLIPEFNKHILLEQINVKMEYKTRNAQFQRKLIKKIDEIIDNEYDPDDPANARFFRKTDIIQKLNSQESCCNICKSSLQNKKYEADHIVQWSLGGKTIIDNLQILCVDCHRSKTSNVVADQSTISLGREPYDES